MRAVVWVPHFSRPWREVGTSLRSIPELSANFFLSVTDFVRSSFLESSHVAFQLNHPAHNPGVLAPTLRLRLHLHSRGQPARRRNQVRDGQSHQNKSGGERGSFSPF